MTELDPITSAVGAVEKQSADDLRGKVLRLELEMLKHDQVEIRTTHHFAPGIYAREIFIPKGTLLTGKIHKTDHINVLSQGEITVLTDQGMKRLTAPCTFVAAAGTKRAGYAHEDSVWTTFHASQETDLERLEDELIAPSFDALPVTTSQKLEEK
jgi:hypothetical protein